MSNWKKEYSLVIIFTIGDNSNPTINARIITNSNCFHVKYGGGANDELVVVVLRNSIVVLTK